MWSSSNPAVASINSATGVIRGIAPGAVNITYTLGSGCYITKPLSVFVASPTNPDEGVANTTLPELGDLSVIPNPNIGTFTIRGSLNNSQLQDDQDVWIEITDLPGQVIYRTKTTARGGIYEVPVTLSNSLASGMYLLSVHTAASQKVAHVVIVGK